MADSKPISTPATVASPPDNRAAGDPLKNQETDRRMDRFKASPDPWKEVVRMEFGGDRTFASGLQTLIFDANPSQYAALEQKLAGVLEDPACTDCARDWVCRMLQVIGSPACLPAVAPLLAHDRRSHLARYALEAIPGGEVDEALRAALPKLGGDAKAGLIGSIARRGDRQAATLLQAIVADKAEPAVVREAAERALIHLNP